MKDLKFKIDENKCIKCAKCVNDCLPKVLQMDDNGFPYARNPERCIKCQHCLAICPSGALSIFEKNPSESASVSDIDSYALLNLIKSRRSYRKYKNENLDKQTQDKLKNMLKWVPTGVNFHKLKFSFIDDIEVMNDFRNCVNKKVAKLISNPFVQLFYKRYVPLMAPIKDGYDVIFRGAPHMVVVSVPKNAPCKDVDPIIALSYFELYAQSLGVATCWCGFAYNIFKLFPQVLKRLEIPKDYQLSYVMLYGPKDTQYHRASQPDDYEIVSVK